MIDLTVFVWGYLFPVVFLGFIITEIGKEIFKKFKNK
tara:strand:+ start:1696 stop:1806 length:111 start_codon:yes stop_codon:yes gene_type:complete